MTLGYTTGVYDLFHLGHLNLLRNAKGLCDTLIVGVSTDEVVAEKFKRAVIPFKDRMDIVGSISFVDEVVPQTTTDKVEEHKRLGFNSLFVGDDWFQTEEWVFYEEQLPEVTVVYLPYTTGVSTTTIKDILSRERQEQ